ncbi:hypothetical protein N836_26090 [Leptolyngbya sp. Heron Island J]|uniref:hypothetical protein n=1 Tax=Leptolyngbya sp. Heron Island J TaxID=1385935 RepID=UPI0003B9C17E|nr:hypothetical protein [Leptolyngbya sp. Heron Island J]ESA32480.1 hypothetical protein N836_26090 [Leptolyngbya sp. Heron Island J]
MKPTTDEQRRLAGAMGVDPDDPLITLLKPIADLAEEMKAWKDIDIELLKFLRSTSQGVERTATNFSRLANSYTILEEQSTESTKQIQAEKSILMALTQNIEQLSSLRQSSHSEIQNKLSSIHYDLNQTKVLSARRPIQWVPLALAIVISALTGWVGWKEGRLNGYRLGRLETTGAFGGETNTHYWSQVRKLNRDVINGCREQEKETCSVELP